jgi:signal transduction histidine kinase
VLPFGPGLLSVAFDVSEERRREHELRDFATAAAHDLREPLVGVHVMAALLSRRGGLGVEEQEMVRLLDDGVQRATGLVDSILEYATAAGDGVTVSARQASQAGPSRCATMGSACPRTARSSRCSRAVAASTKAAESASRRAGGSSRPTEGVSGRSLPPEEAAPFSSCSRCDVAR